MRRPNSEVLRLGGLTWQAAQQQGRYRPPDTAQTAEGLNHLACARSLTWALGVNDFHGMARPVPSSLREFLARELARGERVVWHGQPAPRRRALATGGLFLFGIFTVYRDVGFFGIAGVRGVQGLLPAPPASPPQPGGAPRRA